MIAEHRTHCQRCQDGTVYQTVERTSPAEAGDVRVVADCDTCPFGHEYVEGESLEEPE